MADTTTEKANEIVSDTTENSVIVNNKEGTSVPPVSEPVVDNKTVVTTGSKSGFNFDPWIALAGAAGLAGVGGIAAAAAMSAKSSKPKEEKKEEPQQQYQPREQQQSFNGNNVFLKIQELQKQNNGVKE